MLKTKRNDKTENPFDRVKAEWNEAFASHIIAKRNWQVVSLLQLVVILVLGVGLIISLSQFKVIPYIVEVDQLGRAAAIAPASEGKLTDERVIRAHLYRFIELTRSIITDPEAMRKNFREAYRMVTPSVKRNFLDDHYRNNDPFELATQLSRQVVPLVFLKQSDNTFLLEWKEVDRDLASKTIIESHWKALVTVTQIPHDSQKKMELDPLNPFGIFITSLSWSKAI